MQFTTGFGRTTLLGCVRERSRCDPVNGGWYYDIDPERGASPHTITLCGTSCTALRGDAAGRVDILLGCATQRTVP